MQVQIKREQNDIHTPEQAVEVPIGHNGNFPMQMQIQSVSQSRLPPPLMAASHATTMTNQNAQFVNHGQMQARAQGNQEEPAKQKISENQIDYSSCKGMFGWTTIDGVNVPYIFRKDRKFVSVRIVEQKLLSRYPNSYPDELGKHQPLTSFFVTEHEANLLNEINLVHCGGEFGTKQFNIKDLIVLLEDFEEFYNLVKKTFPENMMNEPPQHQINKALTNQKMIHNQQGCGWIQVNNTITPYVKRISDKYVPLSVMKYAASLNVTDKGELPEAEECELLNKACQEAGFNFTFSKSTRIVSLTDIMKQCQVHVIDLPSENPLEYAQYLEFQQSPSVEQQYGHDLIQSSQSVPDHIKPPMPQDPNRLPPPRRGVHPAFMDPRFMFSYNRFPFHMYSYGPPNVTVHPSMASGFGPMNLPPSQYTQNGQIMNGQQGGMRPSIPNGNSQVSGNSPVRTSSAGSTGSSGLAPQRSPGISSSGTPQWCEQGTHSTSPNSRNFSHLRGFPQQGPPFFPPGNYPPRHVMQGPPISQQNINRNARPEMRPGPQRPAMPPPYPYGQVTQITPSCYQPPPRNRMPQSNSQPARNGVSHRSSNPPPPHMSGPYPARESLATTPRGIAPPVQSAENIRPKLSSSVANILNRQEPLSSNVTGNIENQRQINNGSQIPRATTQINKAPEQAIKPAEQLTSSVLGQVVNEKSACNISDKQGSKPETSLTECIKGVWLGGKSISCMHMERPHRTGKFCLVEAVCKLYFNGCSVNEFLFALENVLKIPLVTCTDEEEKAFIQYYSLPVTVLKCNKMINFDDLGKYFPQLSYVFRGKTGTSEPQKTVSQSSDSKDDQSSDKTSESNGNTSYMTVPLSTVSESQNGNQKRAASGSPGAGNPPKQPCRRLEETVQRLLNQQGTSVTGEQDDVQPNQGTASVIVLD